MTNKIQALQRLTIDKIQILERLSIFLNTQAQTEEFRVEPTIPLHYETEVEQPKVIRTPTLAYPITI